MPNEISRRETLRRGLTATGLLAMAVPDWAIPALAQGERAIAFTDVPDTYSPGDTTTRIRSLDIRTIDGPITPRDKFFAIQHYGRPEIAESAHRLKITGLVDKETELSMAELKAMPATELTAGYECSGNSGRIFQGLASNGRWTGVRLSDVLKNIGVKPKAREVIFFGADRKEENVGFRQQTFAVEQQFGRSMSLENAMRPSPLLAYAMNGEPLTKEQGFPLRLVMPGWYGVANVKWLAEIQLQQDRYVGNFQARWYRTMMGEKEGDQVQSVETEVTRMQLKSVVARVSTEGSAHKILGFVLNDGTPLSSVEVKIDDGPWQRADFDPSNTEFSWKLFSFRWEGATPGEHTIVSRATDVDGMVQPVEEDLALKQTFLEHNAQFPRKVMVT
ncbi:MAG: molybdopterin-dependent oxidoreductase [Acidobacteria bacterium]|nr:molybdopterin-dependent oxidoreductase [Acidobacteriota bacterium]MDA1233996.1 molybdopterin-dependent oxidoreductase [Acidobacteriota bacterium]